MINTNGLRLAKDDRLLAKLQSHSDRVEVYLQFDGTSDETYRQLRGEPLLDIKLRAIDRIGAAGLHLDARSCDPIGVNEKN